MSQNNSSRPRKPMAANKPKLNTTVRQAPKQAKLKVSKWEQMVVNPLEREPVRTPSQSPFTGAVRTFVRTFAISSAGAASPFSMAVRPSLSDTLAVQRSSSIVLPPNYVMSNFPAKITTDRYLGVPVLAGKFCITAGGAPTIAVGEYESTYDPDLSASYYNIVGSATTQFNLNLAGRAAAYQVFARTAGVWNILAEASGITGHWDITTPTVAGGFDALLFTAARVADSVSIYLSEKSGTTPVLSAAQCYDLFSTDAVTLGKVANYRVTAMSILSSYSGNLFNNGGVIAAARVRSGYTYNDESPYQALTTLQDHSYRGVIRDGAYVWWLPYSLSELEFRYPSDVFQETELRVAGTFEDASGSLQVTLAMTVEFYSPLQIFEHKVGPALLDDFTTAYHHLDSVPAATCNPKHTDLLKGIIGKAKAAAKLSSTFVSKHPELAYTLLAMI